MKKHSPEIFGLALGIYATLSQIILMREALSLAGGNELTLSMAFAFWLSSVGLGAIVANRIPWPTVALFVGPIAIGGLLVLRLHREILDLPAGGDPGLGALAIVLALGIVPVAITVGFLFTAAARNSTEETPFPAARLFAAEAMGALVCGLVFAFLLAQRATHLTVLGVGVSVLAAATGLAVFRKRIPKVVALIVALIFGAAAFGPLKTLDLWSVARSFDHLQGSGSLVAHTDSSYGRLTLGNRDEQYQLYTDGRIDFAFTQIGHAQ